jgi:hypothetical protein
MTRRAIGSLGAAALLALVLVGFVPQPALARAPSVAITSPGNGAVLTQPVGIAGQASMQNGDVDFVQISIESLEGHPVPATNTVPGNDSPDMSFTWTPPLAYNGNYKVTALAQGSDRFEFNGPEVTSVAHAFTLNVPPAAPSGVKATVNQTKRTITVSWDANPEPDLVGYGVYRKDGDQWIERKTATPDQTSFTDDIGSLPAGTYTYHVYAARPTAGGNGFIPSEPTTTSGKVTSSPPPPSSTTTVKGSPAATTTTAPGTKPTTLATRGKADLSGFTSLLPSGGSRLPAARSTPPPDGGFDEDLPFGGQPPSTEDEPAVGDDTDQALGEETLASSNDDPPSTLRFMAAGLLVTVVLMHLLWLRDEVNREPLPAIAPDEPADE